MKNDSAKLDTLPLPPVRPSRVIIDRVKPSIDGGRFAAKRYLDEKIKLTAHLLVDGHGQVKGRVHIHHLMSKEVLSLSLQADGNDEWSVEFQPQLLGFYAFQVQADFAEQKAQDVYDPASTVVSNEIIFQVLPARARFSTWYEFFPRSTVSGKPRHGTLLESIGRLPYIQKMGFDVVYLPPIHPIGKSFRKGKNNSLEAGREDVGSPWAIGSEQGGHKEILPELGNLNDFKKFVSAAKDLKMHVAMDLAFQCSPNHPYVKDHPEWFKKRPDGSIQYAENPPKKYQDIYPFDFDSEAWQSLWLELYSIVEFWIHTGVSIFRVDNPHTKSFHFWEWLIKSIHMKYPDVIFLSEAFTRPKIMAYLAKLGFSQSYTYFTWRNSKWELTQYMTELTQTELADYFIPNFWPNTPDILPYAMQASDASLYKQRLILAATLSSCYGIYGPVFELIVSAAKAPGEEYLDSEKYELRQWDLSAKQSLAAFIAKINSIRKAEKALQSNRHFIFHPVSNDNLIAYSKSDQEDRLVTVVNLDSKNPQSGWLELPLLDWNIPEEQDFEVHDLLTDTKYSWRGWRNFVLLQPESPAHILKIKTYRKTRIEDDHKSFE